MGRARRNEEDGPPAGYSYIGLMDLDENYEIAMDEDNVMAYKIIGRVTDYDSPKNERMWADVRSQGRSRLTHADVAKYFTLPENFYPETTLVGVGYDGKGYNVYFLNEEDIASRTVARRLPSAEDAEYLARHTLADAKKPRMAARIHDRRAHDIQFGHFKKNPGGMSALRNMAGRPGRLGLPRYEGPRPEGYAKFGKKDLRDMASSGDQLAAMELEWRKQDKALRAGMIVPERVVKRPAHPPQVTAFAPGFGAVPAVEKGQQVFRITLHGQPLPTEKMPAGRYALTMERAAAMSHKLDPQTGERLRFGKTKSQRRGSKAAANPRMTVGDVEMLPMGTIATFWEGGYYGNDIHFVRKTPQGWAMLAKQEVPTKKTDFASPSLYVPTDQVALDYRTKQPRIFASFAEVTRIAHPRRFQKYNVWSGKPVPVEPYLD